MQDSLEKLKQEVEQVYAEAELLHGKAEVEAALDQLAAAITVKLRDKNPLVLCLMIGAVIVVGKLLPRLNFPLQLEYVHATRYREKTTGGAMHWVRAPGESLHGRTVLLVDDILDEGVTLSALIEECRKAGATDIYTAVLVDKLIKKPRALKQADFTGLEIPDYYVFGYGMDYKGYLRNAPGIYAVKKS